MRVCQLIVYLKSILTFNKQQWTDFLRQLTNLIQIFGSCRANSLSISDVVFFLTLFLEFIQYVKQMSILVFDISLFSFVYTNNASAYVRFECVRKLTKVFHFL